MDRRTAIKAIAAGGLGSIGTTISASQARARVAADDLDELRLVSDGVVVESVTDPTHEDALRLESRRAEGEWLVTPEKCPVGCDECCFAPCCSDCPSGCLCCQCQTC